MMEEDKLKKEYARLVKSSPKAKPQYKGKEEVLALQGDIIIGRAADEESLRHQLKGRGLDPEDYRIIKTRVKLVV